MNWYPFDLQTCSMVLSMKGKGEDFASLYPDQLRYLGKDEVNQYVVYSYKLQRLPENPSQVIIIAAHFIIVQSVPGWGCNSHGKEPLDYPPHHICPDSSSEHDQLLYKLFQTFLFWSLSDCEPHSYAGPYNLVYQCKCPSFTDLYITALNIKMTIFKCHWMVQVSNSLPPTSYIKMIDIYLIFSLMIPFGTVLLQTYMDRLRL